MSTSLAEQIIDSVINEDKEAKALGDKIHAEFSKALKRRDYQFYKLGSPETSGKRTDIYYKDTSVRGRRGSIPMDSLHKPVLTKIIKKIGGDAVKKWRYSKKDQNIEIYWK